MKVTVIRVPVLVESWQGLSQVPYKRESCYFKWCIQNEELGFECFLCITWTLPVWSASLLPLFCQWWDCMKHTMTNRCWHERKVLQPQSYLCLVTEQLETLKYVSFSSLNWKILTIRRDGSIGTRLLPLVLMGVQSLRNSIFHYSLTAATKRTK